MTKPKVAIITRTKDRPAFLKRAIASVSAQTYKNYIHVIVNDGGNKEDVESVVEQSGQKNVIRLFHRDIASGAPDTIFNESIDRVDSVYIAIHDDDDTWHCEFLERAIQILDTGVKGIVVRTDKIIESFDGRTIKQVKAMPYMYDMSAISLYRQCIDNQLTPIAFMYNRNAYEEIGKYDSKLPVVGDWEFGIRFLQKYDVEFIDPGFALAQYHHRIQKDNSFGSHQHRRYITIVHNQYLRDDLAAGKFGVGFIMNSLRYEQDLITRTIRRLVPNTITRLIRKRVRD